MSGEAERRFQGDGKSTISLLIYIGVLMIYIGVLIFSLVHLVAIFNESGPIVQALSGAVFGDQPWPELDSAQAGNLLWLSARGLSAVVVIVLVLPPAFRQLRRMLGTRHPPSKSAARGLLGLVGVSGVFFILLGVLHILVGALVPEDPATGLWADRTAFPLSMTTVGGTLIGFAGLAWSLKAEQQARAQRSDTAERRRRLLQLENTVKNVRDTITSCQALADRGFEIVIEHLEHLKLINNGGSDVVRASTTGPSEDLCLPAWFQDLFKKKEDEDWPSEWEWASGEGGSCPQSAQQLVDVIGHRFYDSQEWRIARQICSIVDEVARDLTADAKQWQDEYSALRGKISGVSADHPLDLQPFVDDLEFVRDLVRVGIDITEAGGAEATSEHLVMLAAAFASLESGRIPAPSHGSFLEEVRKLLVAVGLNAEHRENEVETLFGGSLKPCYSTLCSLEPNSRESSDIGDAGSEGMNPRQDDPFHQYALVLLARVRRLHLDRILQGGLESLQDALESDERVRAGDSTDSLKLWQGIRDELHRVPFGTQTLRVDLPRLRWTSPSRQRGTDRLITLTRQVHEGWGPPQHNAEPRGRGARRREFDWTEDVVEERVAAHRALRQVVNPTGAAETSGSLK